jgi:hypothetical protein
MGGKRIMEKYYKLKEEKVIRTVTTIPQHMWERKGLLPYERIVNIENATEESKESSIDIQSDKVVETITKYKIAPTLDEVKTSKKRDIRSNCEMSIMEEHSTLDQSLAALGMIPNPKIQEMKDFIQVQLDKRNLLINQINSSSSIEEINLIVWS